MKILISGAYGFVGTNLSRFLSERGHVCLALDVAKGDAPYAAFYTWDQLEDIDWSSIDAVVHLAGKAHDTKNVTKPQVYFDINVGLTQRLFNACGGKVGTFIFFSSIKAVDGDTPYAQSKREAEKWLNGRSVVLEPAMIHGPGNKGNLNLLYSVVKHGFPWPLASFENQRSFTSIGNVCAVVEQLCWGKVANGIYPLCDDESVSTNRLIELIAESLGRRARLWHVPRNLIKMAAKVGDWTHLPLNNERLGKLTETALVDNSKLKVALGWEKMPIRAEDGFRYSLRAFAEAAKGR